MARLKNLQKGIASSAVFDDVYAHMSMKKTTEPKSIGTKIAEKFRAKANSYTDTKRQRLLERGLTLIYGGSDYAKANRGRS